MQAPIEHHYLNRKARTEELWPEGARTEGSGFNAHANGVGLSRRSGGSLASDVLAAFSIALKPPLFYASVCRSLPDRAETCF